MNIYVRSGVDIVKTNDLILNYRGLTTDIYRRSSERLIPPYDSNSDIILFLKEFNDVIDLHDLHDLQ